MSLRSPSPRYLWFEPLLAVTTRLCLRKWISPKVSRQAHQSMDVCCKFTGGAGMPRVFKAQYLQHSIYSTVFTAQYLQYSIYSTVFTQHLHVSFQALYSRLCVTLPSVCYNDSFEIWKVLILTTTKFKSLMSALNVGTVFSMESPCNPYITVLALSLNMVNRQLILIN